MAEASDFKSGTQLGFAKARHKITPIEKSACGLGLGKFPKIVEFPYNISATTEASNFKIGTLQGFAKAHHKIPPQVEVDVALCYRSSTKFWGFPLIFVQLLKLATSNLACSWGWPRPTIKTTTRGKIGLVLH